MTSKPNTKTDAKATKPAKADKRPTVILTDEETGETFLPDDHGRKLPTRAVPVKVTFTWADGSTETRAMAPKTFGSGSVGGYWGGKLESQPTPDGRPFQVSLSVIYCAPKGGADAE